MKNFKIEIKTIFTLLVIAISFQLVAQVNIDLSLNSFQVNKLSDFIEGDEDQITIELNNLGEEDQSVKVGFTIRKISGVGPFFEVVSTLESSDICTEVFGSDQMTFVGRELEDLFNNENFQYIGITELELTENPELSEGMYEICAFIGSCDSPFDELGQSCKTFSVISVDPPNFISICEQNIDLETNSFLNINWQFIPPPNFIDPIQYRVRIAPIEDGQNANEAIEGATDPNTFEELFDFSSIQLFINDDIILEPETDYAIQVTAVDETESFIIKGEGKSEVCTFRTSDSGITTLAQSFPYVIQYPELGKRVPFSFFPIIVKYGPYSETYKKHDFEFDLDGPNEFHQENYDHHGWINGPRQSQQNNLDDCGVQVSLTEERAQFLAYNEQSTPEIDYVKGEEYSILFTGEMRDLDFNLIPEMTGTLQSSFTVGMEPSLLLSPANDAILFNDTTVTLKFTTSTAPDKLVPDYYIYRTNEGGEDCDSYNGVVYEACRLEVSKDETFADSTDIVYDSVFVFDGRNELNPQGIAQFKDLFDPNSGLPDGTKIEDFKSRIYKDISIDTVFSEEGDYFWRAVWIKDPSNKNSNLYEESETHKFTIKKRKEEASDTTNCQATCNPVVALDTEPHQVLSPGARPTIGNFYLNVTEITGEREGQIYDGKGYVEFSFLLDTKIGVTFKDVQVNTSDQIFAGEVLTQKVPGFDVDLDNYGKFDTASLTRIKEDVSEGFSLAENIYNLASEEVVALPLKINIEDQGDTYMAGIIDIKLTPENANMQVFAKVELPFWGSPGNQTLAFAGMTCITPGGVEKDFSLFRIGDFDILDHDSEDEYALTIKGIPDNFNGDLASVDTTNITYLEWDCEGFKKLQIAGELDFPRTQLLPVSGDSIDTDESKLVTAKFRGNYHRGGNFFADVKFDEKFALEAWRKNIITAGTASLDYSSAENPVDIKFPEAYNHEFFNKETGDISNEWTGFFLAESRLKIRDLFGNNDTINGTIKHIIIDESFSFDIGLVGLAEFGDGFNVDDWAIAVDTLSVSYLQSFDLSAKMTGKLAVPLFDEDSHLKYRAIGDFNGPFPDDIDWSFVVFTDSTITMPILNNAQVTIDSASVIEIGNSSGETNVTANISGFASSTGTLQDAMVVAGASISKKILDYDSLRFENIGIDGLDINDDARIDFTSPQKFMSGFPITINDAGFEIKDGKPAFFVEPQITLTPGPVGVSGSTKLVFNTELEDLFGGKRFALSDISLDSIGVNFDWNGFAINGGLGIYSTENTEGYRGELGVKFPFEAMPGIQLRGDFGNFGNAEAGGWDTENYFGYWNVDGVAEIPGGIPLFAGFEMIGIGGGVYSNMRQSITPSFKLSDQSTNKNAKYVPSFGDQGALISTVVATASDNETFNMDVALEVGINSGGGLNYITLEGDGFAMADPRENREDPSAWGELNIRYDHQNGVVDGDMYANLRLEGGGSSIIGAMPDSEPYRLVDGSFSVDGSDWFLHIGKPSQRATVDMNIGNLASITAETYLMIGDGVPTELPAIPNKMVELLGSDNQFNENTANQLNSLLDQPIEGAGTGFAHGLSIEGEVDFNDWPLFYLKAGAIAGYDINISKSDDPFLCDGINEKGINGWYAQGQGYGGFWGDFGLHVDVYFYEGNINLIDLEAALLLQVKTPNPTFFAGDARIAYSVLDGLVSGEKSLHIEFGEECLPAQGDPLAGIEFINEVSPSGNDVSAFSNPSATFHRHVEKEIFVPSMDDEGNSYTRTLKAVIEKFECTLSNSTANIGNFHTISNDKLAATMQIDDPFESNENYKVYVEVRAREKNLTGEGWTRLVKSNGVEWSESKESNFNAADRPNTIEEDRVVFAYPINNQNYFLKGETNGGLGYITFTNNFSYLFPSTKTEGGSENTYQYFTRFIKLSDPEAEPIVQPIEADPQNVKRINFNVNMLENDEMYAMQIVQKLLRSTPVLIATEGQVATLGNGTGRSNSNVKVPKIDDNLIDNVVTGRREPVTSDQEDDVTTENKRIYFDTETNEYVDFELLKKKLPGEVLKSASEFILYNYHFATSKFDNYEQKIANQQNFSVFSSNTFNHYVQSALPLEENFDTFEKYGLTKLYKNGTRRTAAICGPLINLWLPSEIPDIDSGVSEFPFDPYIKNKLNFYVYHLGSAINTFVPQASIPAITTKTIYEDGVRLNSIAKPPLTDSELLSGVRNDTGPNKLSFKNLSATYGYSASTNFKPVLENALFRPILVKGLLGIQKLSTPYSELSLILKSRASIVLENKYDPYLLLSTGNYGVVNSYNYPTGAIASNAVLRVPQNQQAPNLFWEYHYNKPFSPFNGIGQILFQNNTASAIQN